MPSKRPSIVFSIVIGKLFNLNKNKSVTQSIKTKPVPTILPDTERPYFFILLSTVRVDTLKSSAMVGILNPSLRRKDSCSSFISKAGHGAEFELGEQNRLPLLPPTLTGPRLLGRCRLPQEGG